MAARRQTTERQRRLGTELRRMREQVGMSLGEAAAIHRVDKPTVSSVESARVGVSADRVRIWAANYSCPDQGYVDALAEMARERSTNWWDEYRDTLVASLLDLAELEHHAVALRHVQITHLPGLLQREDYARTVFQEAVPPWAPDALERVLAFRMRRREVLDRIQPPMCTFLVHEASLRMEFGGRQMMKAQLDHLLKQSDRENVTIRVVPFAAGAFPNAGSSTVYACGPVRQLDTVQIDIPTGTTFLHAVTHLANYREVLDRMEQRALGASDSRDFIRQVLQEL
ncbi:helix-turn-helix transcriptional regulator [Streptomyces sp. XD-27]|uniref:helix-turn-helix domain-containing protein n=1 Tax=Streptomyces sp. XD-27 TaxID=3062779 RepID=UPI0026F46FB3|nr:helix-turn-helix transcriptional regulator [Streptomyces sp. XD-27]WKX71245.1 helix-turn-helix transcriptional regulator [Streptomyces sp. XD-27]